MDASPRPGWPQSRSVGILFGLGTHLLFFVMVWFLFWFLKDGSNASPQPSLLWDAFLSLQFVVVHSWLLLPSTKRQITRYLAPEFYGCMFCVATTLGLSALLVGWQGSPEVIWDLPGVAGGAVTACFYGSWALLFYSLSLTGLGYQTGLTPWLHWFRRQTPARRNFAPRGVYLHMRHPTYLAFLGLVWFTPKMTLDHALLTAIWTAYIFVGSYLKDERLAFYYGDKYREYQTRVTGFPLFGIGPLGIRRPMEVEPAMVISKAN